MNILFLGDIVGRPGRKAVKDMLPALKKEKRISFVIANAENAAGGSGITAKVASELFDSGINVITSGDHIWKQGEIVEIIEKEKRILRPANLAKGLPGKGANIFKFNDEKIAVVNLQGRVFMEAIECPFRTAEELIKNIRKETKIIIVDMHAEATSEKVAMGHFLDGKITALIGTHTHIQTADEKILPGGTAYLTDAGMTGPCDSVIGREKDDVIRRFYTGMPVRFRVAENDIQLQGAMIEVDENSGKAAFVERVVSKFN